MVINRRTYTQVYRRSISEHSVISRYVLVDFGISSGQIQGANTTTTAAVLLRM